MKLKLKFNLASIKSGLLEHGEKLGLALVGIVVLMFIYGAARREVLDAAKDPEKLQQLADRVTQHVANSQWDPKREAVQSVDYTERAKSKPVEPKAFALSTPFNPPVIDPKAKRGEPEVLGVEELRVAAGYDVFEVKGDAAEAGKQQENKLLAQPWAVVTGLVPWTRQEEEYERVFRQSQGYEANRDVPKYFVPLLERAEFDPANPQKVEWKRVSPADKYEAQWGTQGRGNEIISKRFLDEELTARLGPLANAKQQWGEAVSHPKAPLESQDAVKPAPVAEPAAEKKEGGAAEDNVFRSRGGDRNAQQLKQPPPAAGKPAAKEVEYRLLRVFDYTAEPGKKYRYRVTLLLENPNYERPPQFLRNPESARSRGLVGKPSEATDVVAIPTGHRVLAGPVDGGSRYAEPTARLLVTKIERAEGLEAATELKNVQRGSRANAPQKAVKVKHPTNNDIRELTLDFQSNIVVLDIYGGRSLGRRRTEPITSPGEILVMDADGNITVRNDIDDAAQYESTIVRDEPPPKAGLKEEADAKPRREPPARANVKPPPKKLLKQ
jgi:hypothetical protein